MDSKEISQSLRELAGDKTKRNKTGILREVLDDIEACLNAGISQTDVVKVLNEHGLEISFGTFVSTLRRLRQQREKRSTAKYIPTNINSNGNQKAQQDNTSSEPTVNKDGGNSGQQIEGETDNQQTIFNPSDLREALSEKVDLNALAKIGRELNRKRKNEKRSD